ncbi:MAG: hydrogenase expression/formation protein HypE, partial [candidate division WOR-3 bacterium]
NVLGKEAVVIGEITKENKGKVVLETVIGGERIIDRLVGDQLPRIC